MLFEILSTCRGGGYEYARTVPLHPKANSNGLYTLHRVLKENELGRLLRDDEIVHHVDHDKSNNELSNLRVMTNSEHSKHHAPVLASVEFECGACGKSKALRPSIYRSRLARSKHQEIFCSLRCGAIYQHRGTPIETAPATNRKETP